MLRSSVVRWAKEIDPMSMKHPQKHHDKAAGKRRSKTQRLKQEKKERRLQMAEARAKQK